jgi:hypothetical protein
MERLLDISDLLHLFLQFYCDSFQGLIAFSSINRKCKLFIDQCTLWLAFKHKFNCPKAYLIARNLVTLDVALSVTEIIVNMNEEDLKIPKQVEVHFLSEDVFKRLPAAYIIISNPVITLSEGETTAVLVFRTRKWLLKLFHAYHQTWQQFSDILPSYRRMERTLIWSNRLAMFLICCLLGLDIYFFYSFSHSSLTLNNHLGFLSTFLQCFLYFFITVSYSTKACFIRPITQERRELVVRVYKLLCLILVANPSMIILSITSFILLSYLKFLGVITIDWSWIVFIAWSLLILRTTVWIVLCFVKFIRFPSWLSVILSVYTNFILFVTPVFFYLEALYLDDPISHNQINYLSLLLSIQFYSMIFLMIPLFILLFGYVPMLFSLNMMNEETQVVNNDAILPFQEPPHQFRFHILILYLFWVPVYVYAIFFFLFGYLLSDTMFTPFTVPYILFFLFFLLLFHLGLLYCMFILKDNYVVE